MKATRTMAVVLGIFAASLLAFAQTAQLGKIYLLGPGNSLAELSLQIGTIKSTSNKALALAGVSKSKTFTEFSGTASPVRLRPGLPQTFVIDAAKLGPLPEHFEPALTFATLTKFEVNKKAGTRELLFSSVSGGYVYIKTRSDINIILLNFGRFDETHIKIEP